MSINIEDLHKQAHAINEATEAKRMKVVAKIKTAQDTRQREAAIAREDKRIADLEAKKIEVKRSWLLTNYVMSDSDFEQVWKKDKLQLIREHDVKMASLPRM